MNEFEKTRALIIQLKREGRSYHDIAEVVGLSYYKTWCIAHGHKKNPHYDPHNMSESEKASRKRAMVKWNKKLAAKRKQEREVKRKLNQSTPKI